MFATAAIMAAAAAVGLGILIYKKRKAAGGKDSKST